MAPNDHTPTDPVATVRSVTRHFGAGDQRVTALDGVDVEVGRGRLTVIAGPSGSGKSTLLMILACAERPDSGTVSIGGQNLATMSRRARRRWRRRHLGLVLPQPFDNLSTAHDAAANLRWAARLRGGRAAAAAVDVDDMFARVGLTGAAGKKIHQLSGGEQQRLALLCASVATPTLVVADEPTASLDRHHADEVIATIAALTASGTTFAVATHDERLVAAADAVLRLDHGRAIS